MTKELEFIFNSFEDIKDTKEVKLLRLLTKYNILQEGIKNDILENEVDLMETKNYLSNLNIELPKNLKQEFLNMNYIEYLYEGKPTEEMREILFDTYSYLSENIELQLCEEIDSHLNNVTKDVSKIQNLNLLVHCLSETTSLEEVVNTKRGDNLS